jgi:vitamin B12 transporter
MTIQAGRSAHIIAAAVVASACLRLKAQEQLGPLVVVATRTAEDPKTVGTDADVLTPIEIDAAQYATLADALGLVAGANPTPNGARGADTSLFLRGADSGQVLFLVDGIRLSDANTDYAVFLGGARLGAMDTVEVSRGPQSTLYGSEAVGGVVSLESARGRGAPTSRLELGGGSFGSVDASASTQGASDAWAWNASASADQTRNERENNAFHGENLVLRLDRDIGQTLAVGATLRGFDGSYGDPGDRYTNDPYAHEDESNWLGTVFAQATGADYSVNATLGGQYRRYVAFSGPPGPSSSATLVRDDRGVLGVQGVLRSVPGHTLIAGIDAEDESTRDTGFGSINRRQTLGAVYAEDIATCGDFLTITPGLRVDHFDTFGSAVTGRATAAWLSAGRRFKLRASAGTGFNAPSFLELYGVATGYVGNPNLRPERSTGADAGLDVYLPQGRGSLGATVFRTDARDLITYDFSSYPGTTANVGKARTSGIELEARLKPSPGLEVQTSYTYLEADDLSDGVRLLRRPRHTFAAMVTKALGESVTVGAGVQGVAGAEDVDALTYLTVNQPGYTVARLTVQWRANTRWSLRLRVENALDRRYEAVNGYPALGLGVFGAVRCER